jgi:ferrous iron transport protein A
VHSQDLIKLSDGRRGFRGVVVSVGQSSAVHDAPSARESELERRLLEIGFVEGAKVEILHEGFIGRDPIAVRVDSMRVALRKREAAAILVQETPSDNR